MGRWLEHSVKAHIKAPVEAVWDVWSDLDAMPLWMSWIESVKAIDGSNKVLPDLTEWTLAANGFRFKWKAKIDERIAAEKLTWQSIGGLPTKGCVRFYPQGTAETNLTLSISYELPRILAPLMEANILGGMVTKELQENIDRFKSLVEKKYAS